MPLPAAFDAAIATAWQQHQPHLHRALALAHAHVRHIEWLA